MGKIYRHKNGSQSVSVTLHLTPEAAEILMKYGGERNRGWFISQLLVEKQKRDSILSLADDWPKMPDLTDGIDRFSQYPIAGEPKE